jgi:hypothetical protein
MATNRPEVVEFIKCRKSPRYFITRYCSIHNATTGEWVPFELWPEQVTTLNMIHENNLVLVLKARQLGLTWLLVAYSLWMLLFHVNRAVLLFSRRDDEATHLLNFRLKGMFNHLRNPHALPTPSSVTPLRGRVQSVGLSIAGITDNSHTWQLDNGSLAIAFPTSAGDSYSASMAVIDEADLVPNLDQLLLGVKPTVDGGGKLVMITRSDKSNPASTFKKMYLAAVKGSTPWKAVFLPWWIRPERTQAWYEDQKADFLGRNGSLDGLYEQYPETPEQALMAATLDKRIPPEWLKKVFFEQEPLRFEETSVSSRAGDLTFGGQEIYKLPEPGRTYVIGADPAEGNPTSDDSALEVMDAETYEEVACLAAPMQPSIFGETIAAFAAAYNDAAVLIERNNHGHAVILKLTESTSVDVIRGDDGKFGRVTSGPSKAKMYSGVIDVMRPNEESLQLHSRETYLQLSSIDGATLSAPPSLHDDRAVALGLAVLAVDMVSTGIGGVHV